MTYLIRNEGEGVRAALFDLEADIMEIVWSQGWERFAVADVLDALQQEREIAYTTVMTTIGRLFEKEILTRQKDGRRYLYQPVYSREEFLRTLTRDVFERLTEPSRAEAIAFLVERVGESDTSELDRLEALIARRRKQILADDSK